MRHQLEQVREFMMMQGRELPQQPEMPHPHDQNLIRALIQEELNELVQAMEDGSLIMTADALGDLAYVVLWGVNACGMHDHFEQIFEEIQQSNMSKGHRTHREAIMTLDNYIFNHGKNKASVQCIEENKLYVVIREDGKLIKNYKYKKANIAGVLQGDQFGFKADEIKSAVEETNRKPMPEKAEEPMPSFWQWHGVHWQKPFMSVILTLLVLGGIAFHIWSPYIPDVGGQIMYHVITIAFMCGGSYAWRMHWNDYQDYLRRGGWL